MKIKCEAPEIEVNEEKEKEIILDNGKHYLIWTHSVSPIIPRDTFERMLEEGTIVRSERKTCINGNGDWLGDLYTFNRKT